MNTFANIEDLIIDVTEQSVCRPGDDSYQKNIIRVGCCSTPYCINNEEELLLFTLLSLKSGLTLDL